MSFGKLGARGGFGSLGALGGAGNPIFFNFTGSNLPHYSATIAATIAGTGSTKIAFIGNSTVAGQGAGTDGTGKTGARPNSFPNQTAGLIASQLSVPVTTDSVFGSGGTGFLALGYNPLFTAVGAGWGEGVSTAGGPMLANTTTTNAISYSPSQAVDTFDIYYVQNTGFATFTLDVDGGTPTVVNAAGANSLQKATITATRGAGHVLNIKRNGTGTNLFISAIDAYDSTTKQVRAYNMGWAGSKIISWEPGTNNPFDPQNAVAKYAPDLSLIDLMINDEQVPTDIPTYSANFQSLITKCKLSGDVILIGAHPISTANATAAEQAIFFAAVKALAVSNNLPLVNFQPIFGNWAAATAAGFTFDALHYLTSGYAKEAASVTTALSFAPAPTVYVPTFELFGF